MVERGDGGIQKALERRPLRDLRGDAHGATPEALHVARDLLDGLASPGGGDDVRAGLGEPQAQSPANTGGPAENDGHAAFERERQEVS